MACYVRVPLAPDGIVKMNGHMEITTVRAEATEVVRGDASFLLGNAGEGWPQYIWKCEELTSGKYLIKGEEKYPNL